MNLVLARNCTNSCAYCFETAEREAKSADLISMENVARFANWANNSGLEYLSLLGGEPFLHPNLADIIKVFRRTSPRTSLRILTGGVFNKRLLDDLSPDDVGIIFNINEPRDYKNPKHFDKVILNVEKAIQKGFRVILGFNVWRLDFDPCFMPNLAHKLARTNFRWTVANPQRNSPSNVIIPSQYDQLSKQCLSMLKEASRLQLEAMLDCPVPLCFFDDSELGWVRQYHPGTASRIGICGPVLDVTPELEVLRCFALSGLKRLNVLSFPNESTVIDWFQKHIDTPLLKKGLFDRCSDCVHFKTGRCFGGCLAWHEGVIDLEFQSESSILAIKMQRSMDDGNYQHALELYQEANIWTKTAVPSYIAATACCHLGQWEEAFRFAAYAQDMTSDTTPDLKRFVIELMINISKRQVG